MLETDYVRNNADDVRKNLLRRGQREKLHILEKFLNKDAELRELSAKADDLRHERNIISAKVTEVISQKKDASQLIKKAKKRPQEIKSLGEKEKIIQGEAEELLFSLPNMLHDSVPEGKDESQNVEVRAWGEPIKKDNLEHHGVLAQKNDWADFSSAVKISGAGFYFLTNELALLEHALVRFSIDELMKKGFILVNPPLMLKRKPYEGVTDLDDFENVMYKIQDHDLFLIATSEHSLAAKHMNEIIDSKFLPLKYVAFSPCFRKEIGKHSIDERGLFRVHQFYKVEMFAFSLPENSWEMHEQLLMNAEELMQKLEIPYRVMNVCTGDIGTIASKKYDIEAWSPREKKFIELISCSNCTSFQAARLKIKYRKGTEKGLVHTLNSTAIATTRTLRIILENCQTGKGTVLVPKALQPYMNGFREIPLKPK